MPSAILRFVHNTGSAQEQFKWLQPGPNCSIHVALGLRKSGAEPLLPVTIYLPGVHKEKAYINYTFTFFRDVVTFFPEYMTSNSRRRYKRIRFAIPSSVCVFHSHSTKGRLMCGYFASMRQPGSVWYPEVISSPPPPLQWWGGQSMSSASSFKAKINWILISNTSIRLTL